MNGGEEGGGRGAQNWLLVTVISVEPAAIGKGVARADKNERYLFDFAVYKRILKTVFLIGVH